MKRVRDGRSRQGYPAEEAEVGHPGSRCPEVLSPTPQPGLSEPAPDPTPRPHDLIGLKGRALNRYDAFGCWGIGPDGEAIEARQPTQAPSCGGAPGGIGDGVDVEQRTSAFGDHPGDPSSRKRSLRRGIENLDGDSAPERKARKSATRQCWDPKVEGLGGGGRRRVAAGKCGEREKRGYAECHKSFKWDAT